MVYFSFLIRIKSIRKLTNLFEMLLFFPTALVVRFLTKRFIWEYDPTLGRSSFLSSYSPIKVYDPKERIAFSVATFLSTLQMSWKCFIESCGDFL